MNNVKRDYNFGAGPAMLPTEVLEQIQAEILDWRGTGVSVVEIGHRTPIVQDMIRSVENKLRNIMQIPNNYKVLFTHGGAQGQFCGVPMNLVKYNQEVDYLITGVWSKRAADFAKKYATVNIVLESDGLSIPKQELWQKNFNSNAAYAYYCPNETINGVQFASIPDVGDLTLIADMTSSILSEPIDVSKFGVIIASAQKNLGVAGITVVIVRDDLLNQALEITPAIWNYKLLAESNSSVNTVVVFAIYAMDLMLDWVMQQGGVNEIAKVNYRKVNKLYDYLDKSEFYYNMIDKSCRSKINVPFNLRNETLISKFLDEASQNGLRYLNGHMLVGGCRASLYNAMPMAGVDALIKFMQEFAVASNI